MWTVPDLTALNHKQSEGPPLGWRHVSKESFCVIVGGCHKMYDKVRVWWDCLFYGWVYVLVVYGIPKRRNASSLFKQGKNSETVVDIKCLPGQWPWVGLKILLVLRLDDNVRYLSRIFVNLVQRMEDTIIFQNVSKFSGFLTGSTRQERWDEERETAQDILQGLKRRTCQDRIFPKSTGWDGTWIVFQNGYRTGQDKSRSITLDPVR